MRPLISCEHASGALPPGEDLGLSAQVLASHVSCDRGAARVARRLAALSNAPLHLGAHSRLWVDLNRRETNPAVILAESYGIRVPGNEALDAAARMERIERWHRPYRHAVRDDALRFAQSQGCLHLSMHSFTPAIDPPRRAFDAGVLFDEERSPEREIARAIANGLSERGHSMRLNEPYRGTPEGLTSWLREQIGPDRYVGLEIEASQAWIDDERAIERFARDLADVILAGRTGWPGDPPSSPTAGR